MLFRSKEELNERKIPHAFYGADSENKIIESKGLHFVTDGSVSGEFDIRLLGRFNQENALATALATKALGASFENIRQGLASAIVPGRMELLTAKNGAHIYIDYAHNGLSLENLVEVVEDHHAGQLFLVLGSTGNKGESRRKDFGQVIENHPRLNVILTTDDSNRENPKTIADEIAPGPWAAAADPFWWNRTGRFCFLAAWWPPTRTCGWPARMEGRSSGSLCARLLLLSA